MSNHSLSSREKPALQRTEPAMGRQPNIVIINCDDLGYGDLHPYGGNLRDDHADIVETMDRAFREWEAAMKVKPGGWK